MRIPVKGEELVSAKREVWIVLRCHFAGGDARRVTLDLIRQQDLKQTSHPVNLTWPEFEDFCLREGIAYPPV